MSGITTKPASVTGAVSAAGSDLMSSLVNALARSGILNGADVTVKDTKRFAASSGWGFLDFNHFEPKAPTAKVRPSRNVPIVT